MRIVKLFILILFVQLAVAQNSGNNSIKILSQKKGISIRGLSVPDENTIWASGSSGTIALSINGGENFEWMQVAGYEKRDFRAIHAWNNKEAIIAAVAAPAVILKTKDGGMTWNKVYENADTSMFLDAINFKDENNGSVVGDPINNIIFLLNTTDKGEHWQQAAPNYFKSVLKEGEAFFASSNSNLASKGNDQFLISGGMASRLWINGVARDLDILQGGKSTGANSIAISPNGNKLIIVGGDFAKFKDSEKNITGFNLFLTPNTEQKHKSIRIQKWAQRKNLGNPNGYKSGVTFLTNQLLVTCGTSGVDISKNSGKNWELISSESFHVVKKQPNRTAIFLAGSGGRIGYMQLD
jgi:photosystem II stability/assembly factor-like uncharacterized protein